MDPEETQSLLGILSRTDNLAELEQDTLEAVIRSAQIHPYTAKTFVFKTGDIFTNRVYILISGRIIMHRQSNDLCERFPGDFLGLANYIDNESYTSSAEMLTDGCILDIPVHALRQIEQQRADLFNLLNRIIARTLRAQRPHRTLLRGLLSHPVKQIMRSPVACCGPEVSLKQALSMMLERKIGSLVVTKNNNEIVGILSCASLASAVILEQSSPNGSIMEAACEMAASIPSDAPIWKTEAILQQQTSKYIIISEDNNPVGIVSQTDILRALISTESTLSTQIKTAKNLKTLKDAFKQLYVVAKDAQESNHLAHIAVKLLSETHWAIQRRAIELTLEEIKAKGHGKPPCKFAILIMGSGGRKEMLLNPDQDNGIIIDDYKLYEKPVTRDWFERFCKRMNHNLDKVGYDLCPGEIMARNPTYRKSLSEWKKQINYITNQPTKKAARLSNVLFDFATLYGDDDLTVKLRQHTLSALGRKPYLLRLMTEHDAEGRPAIGFFNQLVTTKSTHGEHIDLKRNGLRIIADAVRIYALRSHIPAQNTTERLNTLVQQGILSGDFSTSILEAYETLSELLLNHQISQANKGKKLNKLIKPNKLSEQTRTTLRVSMRAIKRLQDRLQEDFDVDVF